MREREREKLGQVYSIQTKANQSIVIPNSNHHGRTKLSTKQFFFDYHSQRHDSQETHT